MQQARIEGISRQPTQAASQVLLTPKTPLFYYSTTRRASSRPSKTSPSATYAPIRWHSDFVKAVEATGRKTLIMAGVWTSVCVAFPALQAKADGYKVFVVIDASGDVSKMASDASVARMTYAGVAPVTTNTILSESHRTWDRPDAAKWGGLYAEFVPHYGAVVESYRKAQEVTKGQQKK
jgi:hypothetical protein